MNLSFVINSENKQVCACSVQKSLFTAWLLCLPLVSEISIFKIYNTVIEDYYVWDISKITYNLWKLQERVDSQIHVYFCPSYEFLAITVASDYLYQSNEQLMNIN